jgi:hypothetical protein
VREPTTAAAALAAQLRVADHVRAGSTLALGRHVVVADAVVVFWFFGFVFCRWIATITRSKRVKIVPTTLLLVCG